ncbi:outer membrane protein [Pelagibacterium halotolerans]|uniref:Putative heat resistant agglutinin 1 protein n=1 Tax=Pelagibacterium halotolerans (strain DSM 22347 / JCM 15775 / CGMCC 1.7692 / B2) TaxID=1082931 RepID=G4R970_PELHB|nr:outer membrane beta-barrel protein [Pelagibacterium halotolerans]AEQ52450.1 putative heat resistant agglutinin 1 protein [Pelagibacterium halotolerans B2]QJR17821.1 porin family protein [Pelagibacterium halotolerans]
MKKLVAFAVVGAAALMSTAAMAADPVSFDYPVYKDFVPPYVPPVDEGLKGSFYLRGSVAGNYAWSRQARHPDTADVFSITEGGWGYSAGIGAGYETGTGLRFDATVDYLANNDMTADVSGVAHTLELRSTIVLANAYYDFGLGDLGLSAAGGAFGYVGAGAGVAFNDSRVSDGAFGPWDSNTSFAAAGMAGVGYDFGSIVADLGYRALYIASIENNNETPRYVVDDTLVHELRATLRYRF